MMADGVKGRRGNKMSTALEACGGEEFSEKNTLEMLICRVGDWEIKSIYRTEHGCGIFRNKIVQRKRPWMWSLARKVTLGMLI